MTQTTSATGDCGCTPREPVKSCGLPVQPTCVTVVPPPVCPEPPCEPCPVIFLPYVEPPCVPDCSPCTDPEECVGCNWVQECNVSYPHALPCAPINVGWGQYDGGFMYWARQVCCDDPCGLERHGADEVIRVYLQTNWHHVLDLSTYDEMYVNLMVRRNGIMADMSAQEFVTLVHKIATLGVCFGILQPATPIPAPALFGLAVKGEAPDANNIPTYSLSLTYAGAAIGTPLPLEASWDATGEAVGLMLPAALIPNLS